MIAEFINSFNQIALIVFLCKHSFTITITYKKCSFLKKIFNLNQILKG